MQLNFRINKPNIPLLSNLNFHANLHIYRYIIPAPKELDVVPLSARVVESGSNIGRREGSFGPALFRR